MDEVREAVPAQGGAVESRDREVLNDVFNDGGTVNDLEESMRRDRERFAPLFDERYSHFNQRQRDFAIRVCRERRLNPYANQIYFDLRPGPRGEDVAVIVGITGLRLLAMRSGCHGGNEIPQFEYDTNNKLYRATMKIYRVIDGQRTGFVGSVFWSEYFPGYPGTLFDQKPHLCLGICAEAVATRYAFPDETGALYIPEEMLCRDRAPRRAAIMAPPTDDEPGSPGALKERLMSEFGITDERERQDIIRSFREALGREEDETPAFYAQIYRIVKGNPAVYGGRAAEQVNA